MGNKNQIPSIDTNKPIDTGCSTQAPNLLANNPVVNGAIAPPELPTAETSDSDATCNWRSISFVAMVIVHGYIGPKSKPTRATETALEIIFGIVHTRT